MYTYSVLTFSMLAVSSIYCKSIIYANQYLFEGSNDDVTDHKDHCHGLDCPVYKVLNKTDDYELRMYEKSRWVATRKTGLDYKKASSANFMKLFAYISGANEKKVKIPMTAPVITHVTVTQGPFCASDFLTHFFVPPQFQKDTPNPTDKDVEIIDYPVTYVYVRSYGGFNNIDKVQQNGAKLAEALTNAKLSFDGEQLMTAGYDSPFRLFGRHNEIMVFKK